jgi:hypothetical protein
MISFARHRRAIVAAVLVVSAFSVAIGRAVVEGTLEAQDATGRGYVLGASAGERLIRNGGDLFIKVDPRNGSRALALGTQQVPIGTGIRVHRHATMDEVFYVLSGTGLFVLNERVRPFNLAPRFSSRVGRGMASRIPAANWSWSGPSRRQAWRASFVKWQPHLALRQRRSHSSS